jgi:hypothetical protein
MVRAGSDWQNRVWGAFCERGGEPCLLRKAAICLENESSGHRSDCVNDAPPGKIGTFRGSASARWSERPGETLVGGVRKLRVKHQEASVVLVFSVVFSPCQLPFVHS